MRGEEESVVELVDGGIVDHVSGDEEVGVGWDEWDRIYNVGVKLHYCEDFFVRE